LFTFYFVAEGPQIRRKLLTLIPANQQKVVLETWEVAIEKTGGYLYSRLLLAAASTLVTFILLTILNVPFALPLAMWMGLISQFIPVIGTFIAAALPLLVALLENPWSALVLVIYVILYQQFENYFLGPRITAKTMQLHPAIAIGAALIGGTLAGVLGAGIAGRGDSTSYGFGLYQETRIN
jgi:predicted PurR-regulated permease PerM